MATRRSSKELATKMRHNLRLLSRALARKPATRSERWASTVQEAFSLYTRTSTINTLNAYNGILIDAGWPFPAYANIASELGSISPRQKLRERFTTTGVLTRVNDALLASLKRGSGADLDPALMSAFHDHQNAVFAFWSSAAILKPKQPIITEIENCYRSKFWIACLSTAVPLLDHLVRSIVHSDDLSQSIKLFNEAFQHAKLSTDDIIPGYGVANASIGASGNSPLIKSVDEDLRLPGILLTSFFEFSNQYYANYTISSAARPHRLNRHAIVHCADDQWTANDATRMLTFIDLTLRLEPVLQILAHGDQAPLLAAKISNGA